MPMRRAVACSFVLLGLAAEPALALQPGAPRDLRVARPSDALPRPSARFEEWSVQYVDPRSLARAAFRVVRSPEGGSEAQLVVHDREPVLQVAFPVAPAGRGRLAWSGPEGSARVVRRRDIWTVRLAFETASGVIRLRRARPGVTARRWRLGAEAGYAKQVSLSWSTPIVTSRVAGRIRAGDRSLRLRGWRASLEHRWGRFADDWRAWDHLSTAAVHTRGDSAWILHGMNRRDFVTGVGARDAFWLGVLVHATASRTTFCRPRIVRRGWVLGFSGPLRHERIRAACAGRHVRFRWRPAAHSAIRAGQAWFEDEARAVASPPGAAWMRYAGH